MARGDRAKQGNTGLGAGADAEELQLWADVRKGLLRLVSASLTVIEPIKEVGLLKCALDAVSMVDRLGPDSPVSPAHVRTAITSTLAPPPAVKAP